MIGFFIAILSGVLMSIQGVFNTQVTKASSIWVTNILVQGLALLVCLIIWAISDKTPITQGLKVEPKYMLLGGVIGAGITYTVIKSMDSLGPAKAVMIIVIAQLLVAYLIELFGIWGVEKQEFSWNRLLGMAIAIVGVILFKWNG
ncbi:MAG: DMT family transporter [Lachnospiraceae bacterium]